LHSLDYLAAFKEENMANQVSWMDRLRYALDNTFSRGAGALIAWLGVLSLAVVLPAALLLTLARLGPEGEQPLTFIEAFWQSLMRTMDPGTMSDDSGWGFRIVMLGVTLGGVFVISTLIGVLTTSINSKLEELRKGRSKVIETGHTIILGWSEQIFTVISELVIANQNQPRSSLVVLADKDKVEMEDAIKEKVGSTGRTRVVCRTGSPMEMSDLSIASLNTAKSIIILSPAGEVRDAEVIKIALAIINHPHRHPHPYHIVAQLRDPQNADVASVVGRDEVEWIPMGEMAACIIAQTCRQSGLSDIYTELMDFARDEIYFHSEPALTSRTFGESLLHFEKNALLGLCPAGGSPKLNPPMETIIQTDDQLVLIAEDDDQIFLKPSGPDLVSQNNIVPGQPAQRTVERTLILGWNWRGPAILRELDSYVAPGSELLIVADLASPDDESAQSLYGLRNQRVAFQRSDTTNRRALEALDLERFHHIILLSYSDILTPQQADARTLITLLHLRDIAQLYDHRFSIVSEMLDVRNRNLAYATRADDFVFSSQLASLMLAQVSENKHLNAVFADVFDPEGSEIYLKPAHEYVFLNEPTNFYTVVEAARRRGEVAFGYRLQAQAEDAGRRHGVATNPAKSEVVTFEKGDRIIVLAES
jgi:voltage-gated potassium channel Kch